MIFNRLTVTNIGNFSGTSTFCLRSQGLEARRPIILFGGLNGAGKTTIFDAIKLCLYGSEMFGPISIAKYQEYLKQKVHNSKITVVQPNCAAISLEFDYVYQGTVCSYQVERMWEISGQKVLETLTITKNGLPLDDVETNNWQDFIKEIIPLGLSQLFFFDGEKIQRMMFDDNNEELKKSILSLLGLDVVERLQADLKIYRNKFLKEGSTESCAGEILELEDEKSLIEAKIRKILDDMAALENTIAQLSARIADYRNKIAAQGEQYYRNRVNLEERKKILEHDLEVIKEKLREQAAGLLPVAIASSFALKLKWQIENESRHKVTATLAEDLDAKHRKMLEWIDSADFLKNREISATVLKQVKAQLKDKIAFLFNLPESDEAITEIYGYSQRQTIEIVQSIEKALNAIPAKIVSLTDSYEIKFRELQGAIAQLAKVPDDEFIQPMYETLDKLNVELGILTERQASFDEQRIVLLNSRSELEHKIEQLNRKIISSNELGEKLQSVLKVEQVLSKYHLHLSMQKIYSLEEAFAQKFRILHRKDDMIARIEIDPQTFTVVLYDRNDARISKNSLSSGELEIYAMSMLWALAKVSGQKLPFIVDTPLARLDSKHRDNLVELFFPHASHQMMIFSTDTELDKQYFSKLKPYVGQAYNLEYCEESKSTVVKEGYFWN